jgi:hypothetical protein
LRITGECDRGREESGEITVEGNEVIEVMDDSLDSQLTRLRDVGDWWVDCVVLEDSYTLLTTTAQVKTNRHSTIFVTIYRLYVHVYYHERHQASKK